MAAWLTDDFLYWKPLTEKGEALTGQLKQKGPFARTSEADETQVYFVKDFKPLHVAGPHTEYHKVLRFEGLRLNGQLPAVLLANCL